MKKLIKFTDKPGISCTMKLKDLNIDRTYQRELVGPEEITKMSESFPSGLSDLYR